MTEAFLLIAVLLAGVVALLYFAPNLKLLNFVDYDGAKPAVRINRYAAVRLLLPIFLNGGCAYIARMRPDLSVPLIFPAIISILGAVVWIAAGTSRLKT